MKTRSSSRSIAQDRARVSGQEHEIDHAAKSLRTRGKRTQARKGSVLVAKHKLGRSTSRRKVVRLAESIVNRATNKTLQGGGSRA